MSAWNVVSDEIAPPRGMRYITYRHQPCGKLAVTAAEKGRHPGTPPAHCVWCQGPKIGAKK